MIAFDRKVATVPGKRISDLQVNKYKALRGEHSQEAAAAWRQRRSKTNG